MVEIVDPGPNEGPINEVFIYLSVEENGNEGIVASQMPSGMWMTLITAKQRLLRLFAPVVRDLAKSTGKRVVLVRMVRAETLETFDP